MPFRTEVYCLNPKSIASYKKSYIGLSKNDYIDAFIIADFARVGRITTKPWRWCQYLALQWLTHHRLHLAKALTRENTYMLPNIFLKFSDFTMLDTEESHYPMNSELQHLRFLPNSSLLKRLLTCLWKSLSNSSARKVSTDLQIHRKQPNSCRQLQKIHIVINMHSLSQLVKQ